MGTLVRSFGQPLANQTTPRRSDLICIGRGIADLYADQLGGRLENAISFSIYVGGSACNICIGAARLGLEAAMVLRVGDDHMGRVVRETLERNQVNVSAVTTDPDAPTPICVLGVRDQSSFPRDLFARGGAYLNLEPEDLDPAMFTNARAVLINGSFFASESLRETCRRALKLAREAGCATALDIDYRPALWGLVGHGKGESAFVASEEVTQHFAEFLPYFDLVVGTEEEIAIAGGAEDSFEAVQQIRALSTATIVLKRGSKGCVGFEGPLPVTLEDGVVVPGFDVDVMNTAGAGDSFMAGLTAGWLKGMSLTEASRLANACGAINVARHGCSDSAPSWDEVTMFMQAGGIRQPDTHPGMKRLHGLLGRHEKPAPQGFLDLSMLDEEKDRELLCHIASMITSETALGLIWPATDGFSMLAGPTGQGGFIVRDLPDDMNGDDLVSGVQLVSRIRKWPREHVLRVVAKSGLSVDRCIAISRAAQETRHEVLIDLRDASECVTVVRDVIRAGLRPEWWLLAESDEAVSDLVREQDAPARGVIVQPNFWREKSNAIAEFALDRKGTAPDLDFLQNQPEGTTVVESRSTRSASTVVV